MSPAVLGWVQRDHERKLARAARLHEQRLGVYRDLGQFLETERTRIDRTEPQLVVGEPLAPPPSPTDEEWARLHGFVVVAGSSEVQAALTEYPASVRGFIGRVWAYQGIRDQGGVQVGAHEAMEAARTAARGKLSETERVMRDELAQL